VVQLHHAIEDIRKAGSELYVIGNGAPLFIDGFRETTKYEGPLFTDPSLAVYQAAQLERGMLKTLNPIGLAKGIGAFARGHRQSKTQGDATQQGGVLVVAPGGKVLYQHISHHPGDNAPPASIVQALRDKR
jgi:hypothetical protein